MNSTDRKAFIVDYLEKNYSVKINQLSKDLKVTRETIRKDLYELEKQGLIRKVLGGAVIENSKLRSNYEKRKLENYEAKQRIAQIAATYIEPGDSIYLDYGTTTYCLAEEILKTGNITVVTNSIQIVNLLMQNPTIDVLVLGGMLRKNEDALSGNFGLLNMTSLFVNYGFFSGGGIDTKVGLTNHNVGEAEISREMIKRSQTKVVLMDHTKYDNVTLNQVAQVDEIDILITDEVVSKSDKEKFEESGVTVLIAEE